jgi:predicted Zn-dependent protease
MFKRVVLAILLGLSGLMVGCVTNPVTGVSQFMLISRDQEKRIGDQYAPQIEKELGDRIDNTVLQNYISKVGQKVVRASHTPDGDFEFAAVDDDSVNAMALPGGYIFITHGMLEKVETEAQLASILAHETAHVTARHVAAAMSKQIGIDILMSVAISDETGQAVRTGTNIGIQLMSLRYSRDNEYEADKYGMDYLVGAGYAPGGMIETMDILQKLSETRPIEFLSTHPDPGNRRSELQAKMMWAHDPPGLKTGRDEYSQNVLANLKTEDKEE